jgi:hypothetical protein
MDHRIEKLSTLLDANETQLNEISIKREYGIIEAREYPCSSKFKDNSSFIEHKCEACEKKFPT